MKSIVELVLGLFTIAIGLANIKGNISTIHWYNRRRVTEENAPKYGRVVGTGMVIMGMSLVISFFVMTFWSEYIADIIVLVMGIGGFLIALYGQFKYNRGIF